MALVQISVTAEDIRDGVKFECMTCPVARAVDRVLLPEYKAVIDGKAWGITDRYDPKSWPLHYHGATPPNVLAFVREFDRGKYKPRPDRFHLEIPTQYLNDHNQSDRVRHPGG